VIGGSAGEHHRRRHQEKPSLSDRPLLVDTGDEALTGSSAAHQVTTGYREYAM
jgi:hypothetical protein